MTPRQNAEAVRIAKEKVTGHCMCANFEESASHFLVTYPPGCHPQFDGCRVSKGMGLAKSLAVLHDKMETHWQEGSL